MKFLVLLTIGLLHCFLPLFPKEKEGGRGLCSDSQPCCPQPRLEPGSHARSFFSLVSILYVEINKGLANPKMVLNEKLFYKRNCGGLNEKCLP